ncbi:hypothetical protein RHO13_04560 [Orbus wheelerorum]|uniref:hypothetical protein n=1 Tax=Orbus wheelerorum TaxID=3074111 RepID=UPI00370D9DAE
MKISTILQNFYIKLPHKFIKNESGNILIAFAIMIPAIFCFFIISFNYTYLYKTRARISEASNEASLAIVAIHNKINNNDENKRMALRYINYYLKKLVVNSPSAEDINVEYDNKKMEYYVSYKKPFELPFGSINDFLDQPNNLIEIGNKKDSFGNTRKEREGSNDRIMAVGFIADFSGSITCEYNNPDCDSYDPNNSGETRFYYMREAIGDSIKKFSPFPAIGFAFIPYELGVPVENNENNPAGGDSFGCSSFYKLNSPYDKLNFEFWADKLANEVQWSNLKNSKVIKDYLSFDFFKKTVNSNKAFKEMDQARYRYYKRVVGPALGVNSDEDLVNKNLCKKRINPKSDEYEFQCGNDDPLTDNNRKIIKEQYGTIVQLTEYMTSDKYRNVYPASFPNILTVDVDGTINTMFSQINENIITFKRPVAPSMIEFTPFYQMCLSPIYNNKIRTGGSHTEQQLYDLAVKNIKSFKTKPYLIPFDSNNSNAAKIASHLKDDKWAPGGGTDTITGLLRAVPVFAESGKDHQILIIISDGQDNKGADVLRDEFLKKGVCQTITSGLMSKEFEDKGYIKKAAESAAIHYIKLSPAAKSLNSDADYEKEFGLWFTECMNKDKQYLHIAPDYQSLLDISNNIIGSRLSETGVFIRH